MTGLHGQPHTQLQQRSSSNRQPVSPSTAAGRNMLPGRDGTEGTAVKTTPAASCDDTLLLGFVLGLVCAQHQSTTARTR